MVAGTVKDALSAMTDHLHRAGEIRLYADTVLYCDQDMKGDDFQGVNVTCIAPRIENKKRRGKFHIKTDGKPLDSTEQQVTKAANGEDGTKNDKTGKPGTDGKNGRYGHAGGHILMVANNLDHGNFDLSANGSHGEDGQDGGDGGKGWTPERCGRDGSGPDFSSGWGNKYNKDSVIINYGTYCEDGGPGVDSGMGDAPGKSGISGKIELISTRKCPPSQTSIDEGKVGLPGMPGKGGKDTEHGKDRGGYAAKATFWGHVALLV